jgi:hypothetical protein
MLLQTNSYIVPRDKRMEHARLLRRFRQTLMRLGCDHFEVYEQVGANWNTGETTGRFVQIMRFRDRKHQLAVQGAERTDPVAQALVREFCELINFPYQQQQGLFAVGFYTGFLRMPPQRTTTATEVEAGQPAEALPEHDQFVGEQQGDAAQTGAESEGYVQSGQAQDQVPQGEEAADGAEYAAPIESDMNAEDDAAAGQYHHSAETPTELHPDPAAAPRHPPVPGVTRRVSEMNPADYINDDSEAEFTIVSETETETSSGKSGNGSHSSEAALPDAAADEEMSSEELREAAEALFGPVDKGDESKGEHGK